MQTKTMVWIGVLGLLMPCGYIAMQILTARPGHPLGHHAAASEDNLHNLAIEIRYYEHSQGHFLPAATTIAEPSPMDLHNWQTHLLPFVEQKPLYAALDLNRPWTDPVNEPHFHYGVLPYENSAIMVTTTAAGLALTHYSGNTHMFPSSTPLRESDITDGVSNTLLTGEIATGLPAWGRPRNVRDPGAGLQRGPTSFGGPWADRSTQFSFVDGRCQNLSPSIDPAVLRALATPAGGESVRYP